MYSLDTLLILIDKVSNIQNTNFFMKIIYSFLFLQCLTNLISI